jgi:hypothetical protein
MTNTHAKKQLGLILGVRMGLRASKEISRDASTGEKGQSPDSWRGLVSQTSRSHSRHKSEWNVPNKRSKNFVNQLRFR